jgi:hypothetical protein
VFRIEIKMMQLLEICNSEIYIISEGYFRLNVYVSDLYHTKKKRKIKSTFRK